MEDAKKGNGMGTWRRYKLGQAQFTSWLKQTAEKMVPRKDEAGADGTDIGDAAATPPQQSRRQKKKQAKAASLDLPDAGESTDKFVHWSQLEVLAQRIADNAQPEDVPDSALNILRDVVGLRKRSFRFFSSAAQKSDDEKLKQSNANHAHIIGVLERVQAKLEALVKRAGGSRERTRTAAEPADSSRVTTSDLTNMFAYLEVQTAPDAADHAADDDDDDGSDDDAISTKSHGRNQKGGGKKKAGKKAQKSKKPEKKKKQERTSANTNGGASWVDEIDFGVGGEDGADDEDEFDLYMMVYCFFEDFNAIRNYVAERWCDYWYERSVPLPTLAVLTNAAFELFHQMEFELVRILRPLHPKLATYEFMMEMLFFEYGLEHVDYDATDALDDKEELYGRIWREESDWLAMPTYWTLKDALEHIPPGKVPMIAPSKRSTPVYGAIKLEDWRDFQTCVTHYLIFEAAHVKALKVNGQEPPILPAEPALLFDLQHLLRRVGPPSSALIFSLHLWVDIRNILETEHSTPFDNLQTTATSLCTALQTHNPSPYCRGGGGDRIRDREFTRNWTARVREVKHYMLADFDFGYEDKLARCAQLGVEEPPEKCFLLRQEPVWAGLLDLRARLVRSQLGHEFVVLAGGVVDAAAVVWRAAVRVVAEGAGGGGGEGGLLGEGKMKWEGMEKYVATYREESTFRKGLEGNDGAEIVRNFARSDAAAVAGGGAGLEALARIGVTLRQTFVPAVAVRATLYRRFAFDDAGSWSVVDLAEELHMLLRDGSSSPSSEEQTQPSGKESREAPKQQQQQMTRLAPLDMLRLLDEAVTTQLEGLLDEVDYFGLFDQSRRFLALVADATGVSIAEEELGKLPLLLAQEMEGLGEKKAAVLHGIVAGSKRFIKGEGREQSAVDS